MRIALFALAATGALLSLTAVAAENETPTLSEEELDRVVARGVDADAVADAAAVGPTSARVRTKTNTDTEADDSFSDGYASANAFALGTDLEGSSVPKSATAATDAQVDLSGNVIYHYDGDFGASRDGNFASWAWSHSVAIGGTRR